MRRPAVMILLFLMGFVALGADDHGNSPLAATPIVADGTLTAACIETSGDMDYFLFAAVEGRTYRILTSHLSDRMDTIAYLLDNDGQSILRVDDDSAGEGASRIEWTATSSGTYFLMVRHALATTGTGCYDVSMTITQVDDHGNTMLSATPMALDGPSLSGFLESEEDKDVFLFTVEAGYDYVVELSRTSSEEEIRLELTSASETLAAGTASGQPARLAWSAEASGTLFAIVSPASDAAAAYEIRALRSGYGDDFANASSGARPLASPSSEIQGWIEVEGDQDWFSFATRKDAEYTLSVETIDGSGPFELSLIGVDGTTVLESVTGLAGASADLTWAAPSEDTYYLRVSSSVRSGAYTLSLQSTLQLQTLGSLNPQGYSLDVYAAGDIAYLVVGTKGLLLVDISDPARPVEIGSHSTRGYAQAVSIQGKEAYIANRGEGVTFLDVSDPTRPVETGFVDTPGSAQATAVVDGHLYVADQRGGLQIIELNGAGGPSLVGAFETRGFAQAIAVRNDIAYVAGGDAGLELIDVSQPTSPRSLAVIKLTGDVADVVVTNDMAYAATGYRGVQMIDVSDPTSPVDVGSVNTPGEALDLALAGGFLYVAERTEGLTVYSIADPRNPERVAQIDTPGEALSVAIVGDLALVADREEGLQIIQLLP